MYLPPGDVLGQLTPAPRTCPGDTFTFRCTVTGDVNGLTSWRVNGSSECILAHNTARAPAPCGQSDSPFTVTTGTGFGTSATFYSSTLSSIATTTLNGALVECFGPVRENMVGNSTLRILGQCVFA